MASLANHSSSETIKLLFIGDSGSGKTGALASLVNELGLKLRIADFDNGLDILRNTVHEDKMHLVDYELCIDKFKSTAGGIIPKSADAWPKLTNILTKWGEHGDPRTWGPDVVLAIDSLTFAGKAALRYIMHLNGRLHDMAPYQSDWLEAQRLLEGLCQRLFDPEIKCHVIVNSHITFVGKEKEKDEKTGKWMDVDPRGYPSTVGKAFSPQIGSYFNSVLLAQTQVYGTSVKREIHTQPIRNLELKNSNPLAVRAAYPLATGLASFFKDVRSKAPPKKPVDPTLPKVPGE